MYKTVEEGVVRHDRKIIPYNFKARQMVYFPNAIEQKPVVINTYGILGIK